MYRYEVTAQVKSDIENVIGRPVFYEDEGPKYYINGDKKDVAFQYFVPATEEFISKTLDEICQDLYSTDFAAQSTQSEHHHTTLVSLEHNTAGKGVPQFAVVKPDGGNFVSVVSHDFCDPTTWYQKSTRVTGQVLTLDGTKYSSPHENWIDLVSGKMTREDNISGPYLAKIYNNGSLLGDPSKYTIDYKDGSVTFDASITVGAVTADYSYAGSSEWVLAPETGKTMFLEHAELDFAKNAFIPKGIEFQIWAYNPMDLPNKAMVDFTRYKNMKDILKVANAVTVVPAIGGLQNDVIRAVFDYAQSIPLKSSLGIELRLSLIEDEPLTGEFGTITLYTTSEDE